MKFTSQIKQLSCDELRSSLENLPKNNRWVKLGDELPWDEIEKIYNARLNNERKGAGNKPARLVIGALIIKHEMRLSDEDTVEIIKENPYMQYMLGLSEFSDEPIFDPSLFVYIRKRLNVDDFNKFTESLVKKSKSSKEKTGSQDSDNENDDKPSHNGTLKVDATCCNAEVRFPTDLDLLHDGCEVIERIIDRFCKIAHFHRPDTHMDRAHRRYSKTIKKKNKPRKDLRDCTQYLLAHLSRNVNVALNLFAHGSTDDFMRLKYRDRKLFFTILTMLRQQQEMFNNNVHSCKDRIISIFQPHIRPIVRGKAKAKVEFGSKIGAAIVDGYTYIDHFSWDAYNESEDLKTHIEAYLRRFGVLPARVEADKIYLNRDNRKLLKDLNIECCGKPLGRPPKDMQTSDYEKKMAKYSGERNEIEATFGTGKRVYGADDIRGKLADTGESWTAACYFVKNVMKFLRDLLHTMFFLLDFLSIFSRADQPYGKYPALAR